MPQRTDDEWGQFFQAVMDDMSHDGNIAHYARAIRAELIAEVKAWLRLQRMTCLIHAYAVEVLEDCENAVEKVFKP